MAVTTHGHHIPGTPLDEGESALMGKARCGGTTRCPQCSSEASAHLKQAYIQGPGPYVSDGMNQYADFQLQAKRAVVAYFRYCMERGDTTTRIPITENEVYVVWFCKVLENWKALLGTMNPDGMYYEVTFNGDKNEIYFDAYKKVENLVLHPPGKV